MHRDDLRVIGFESEVDQLEAALEGDRPATIAVVTEPFGGRERFLDHVEDTVSGTVRRFSCGPNRGTDLDLSGAEVVLVDDCHHRFARRVGGFEGLDAFLREAATFEGLLVTSWNAFAWDYLRAVRGLDRAFETVIRPGPRDPEQVRAFVLAGHEGAFPELQDDRTVDETGLLERGEYTYQLTRTRSVTLPYPKLDLAELVRRRRADSGESLETLAFDLLTERADGNPGVAAHIWGERVADKGLAFTELEADDGELGLDYETAFLLQVLVSKERVTSEELDSVVDHHDLDRVLGELSRAGVLTVEEGIVSLRPTGLAMVVDTLVRRRVVW